MRYKDFIDDTQTRALVARCRVVLLKLKRPERQVLRRVISQVFWVMKPVNIYFLNTPMKNTDPEFVRPNGDSIGPRGRGQYHSEQISKGNYTQNLNL